MHVVSHVLSRHRKGSRYRHRHGQHSMMRVVAVMFQLHMSCRQHPHVMYIEKMWRFFALVATRVFSKFWEPCTFWFQNSFFLKAFSRKVPQGY